MISISLVIGSLVVCFSFGQVFLRIFLDSLRYNEYLGTALDETTNPVNYYVARGVILLVLCCVYFILLTKLDNLASLSFFAKFSLFTAVVFCIVMIVYGLWKPATDGLTVLPDLSSGINLANPLGAVIFALHCQFSYMDIFNSMR
ncbi:uncharacterized protein VICG_02150, partial [Vittaforma corneae ATCC 50505]